MKLLSLLLLCSVSLPASEINSVVSVPVHTQKYAVFTSAPLIVAATPRMGACRFVDLIGGFEQKCYGWGVYQGSGPSGTWYKCSLKAHHKWIE